MVKQRRSLYFRALLCCSWGLSIRGIGYLLQFVAPNATPWVASVAISQFGWICMVSGFATVLWSRLGFIMENEGLRKYLLWLIVFNGIVWHSCMTVISFATNAYRRDKSPAGRSALKVWTRPQLVCERIQIVCFCGQEILISSLYIFAAYRYLRSRACLESQKKKVRDIMCLLLATQAVVILIDLALIIIDFLGYLRLKGFIHSFIYCVKLEFEFVVLNQLVEISKLGLPPMRMSLSSKASGDHGAILEDTDLPTPPMPPSRWSGFTLGQPTDDKFSGDPVEVAIPRSTCLEHGILQNCSCRPNALSNV